MWDPLEVDGHIRILAAKEKRLHERDEAHTH